MSGTADEGWFLESGRRSAEMVTELLARNGFAVKGTDRLLDFGCGCGRVTRWWAGLPSTEVFGCDPNAELVQWCQQHLTFGRFAQSAPMPPLPYRSEEFDLITLHSIFTHLTVPALRAWVQELRRVLRPGGLLVLTTHGDSFLDKLRRVEREQYGRGEVVVQFDEAQGSNLCAVYHPPGWIQRELGHALEALDFDAVGGSLNFMQDVYLLRKADGRPGS